MGALIELFQNFDACLLIDFLESEILEEGSVNVEKFCQQFATLWVSEFADEVLLRDLGLEPVKSFLGFCGVSFTVILFVCGEEDASFEVKTEYVLPDC